MKTISPHFPCSWISRVCKHFAESVTFYIKKKRLFNVAQGTSRNYFPMMGVQREMPSQKHVFQRSVYFGHNDNILYYWSETKLHAEVHGCCYSHMAPQLSTLLCRYPTLLSNWPKHTESKYSRNRTGPIFSSGDCRTFCPIFDVI